MIPVTLRPEDLAPGMLERPDIPFLVHPGSYSVVDGDTIRLRTMPDAFGVRHEAFRIRLCGINTPELLKKAMFDVVLNVAGRDEKRYGPGETARDKLREICAGRVILINPVIEDDNPKTDAYGRLLAQVCVSGSKGAAFNLTGAYSVEAALIMHGLAKPMGSSLAPALKPAILEAVSESLYAASHTTADNARPASPHTL